MHVILFVGLNVSEIQHIGTRIMKLLLLILCTFEFISPLEIFPERVVTECRHSKCMPNINFTFRKRSRHSPYYIDFDFNATTGYGNNLTLQWSLKEYISGRFVSIPVQFEYNLCDYLYKDIFFGRMYARQLRGNWSCPFPPGPSIFRNLVTHLDDIPLIPFTYSSLIVRTRVDLNIVIGPPEGPVEEIALIKVYMTVKQHLKKTKSTTKH